MQYLIIIKSTNMKIANATIINVNGYFFTYDLRINSQKRYDELLIVQYL